MLHFTWFLLSMFDFDWRQSKIWYSNEIYSHSFLICWISSRLTLSLRESRMNKWSADLKTAAARVKHRIMLSDWAMLHLNVAWLSKREGDAAVSRKQWMSKERKWLTSLSAMLSLWARFISQLILSTDSQDFNYHADTVTQIKYYHVHSSLSCRQIMIEVW